MSFFPKSGNFFLQTGKTESSPVSADSLRALLAIRPTVRDRGSIFYAVSDSMLGRPLEEELTN